MVVPGLDLLDDLELLALDSFLFDLEAGQGLGADHEGSTPPEEAESESGASDAPPEEATAPPAEGLELTSIEPFTSSVLTLAAGPDHEGFEPPTRPNPEPLNFDLAGFDPPEPPPMEPQFLDGLPDFIESTQAAMTAVSAVSAIEPPLGPDHVGFVPPETEDPEPRNFFDLAGFDPPEPPPEEPEFLDVLPDFIEFTQADMTAVTAASAIEPPLGPDHVGFVPPETEDPEPRDFFDLAGFDPPEPPPEVPEFLDVLI